MNVSSISFIIITIAFLSGCGDDGVASDPTVRDYSDIFSPLPEVSAYPQGNEFNVEKEQLGELLFWDPILSGNQNVACASCHHPSFGWADGRKLSVGSDGIGLGPNRTGSQITALHSPTILNVAFTGITQAGINDEFVSGGFFWDLRADTLEEQALDPILNALEMRGFNVSEQEIMNEIVMRLQGIPEYVDRFEQAFETQDAINSENIAKAIATFERKIFTGQTKFDEFIGGDQAAFTEQEIIGLNKFIDGGCSRCHSGPMLSDNELREDQIIVNNTAVRTPTLRGLNVTAPFMHDGTSVSLANAISLYEDRGDLQVSIGDGDFNDLAVFLRTLDTTSFYKEIPESVPSGLPVGGDIN